MVDALVLPLVLRLHVPLKPILQPRRIILILDLLELLTPIAQRRLGLYFVRLALWDQKFGQALGHALEIAVHNVIDQAHRNAELFKVKVAILVDVCEVPDL